MHAALSKLLAVLRNTRKYPLDLREVAKAGAAAHDVSVRVSVTAAVTIRQKSTAMPSVRCSTGEQRYELAKVMFLLHLVGASNVLAVHVYLRQAALPLGSCQHVHEPARVLVKIYQLVRDL